jgi:hypothetical protein
VTGAPKLHLESALPRDTCQPRVPPQRFDVVERVQPSTLGRTSVRAPLRTGMHASPSTPSAASPSSSTACTRTTSRSSPTSASYLRVTTRVARCFCSSSRLAARRRAARRQRQALLCHRLGLRAEVGLRLPMRELTGGVVRLRTPFPLQWADGGRTAPET